jgi:hypoxia up-regulated 1
VRASGFAFFASGRWLLRPKQLDGDRRRFFGQAQREALVAAAELGGLNVLGLVSEHACAALQWGIDKDFANNTKTVIMYDMGAGSATATLVHYSSFAGKEFGKAKTFGQFEVKGVTWDANCGAADLDMLLVEHFAAEFNEKHLKGKDDVLNYPRVRSRARNPSPPVIPHFSDGRSPQ